jgi:uncharacterized damage-inducible protein DinB
MSIADAFLAEFEQEMQTTRKFLERVPEDKLTWKPHEKSLTAGQLSLHMATALGDVAQMAKNGSVSITELNPAGKQPASVAEVLSVLDHSIAKVRNILPTIDDAAMQQPWSFLIEGEPVLTMPVVGLIRTILLNHLYHHRGQLGVYLRLTGAKVPSSYGPSGDEAPEFLKGKELAPAH